MRHEIIIRDLQDIDRAAAEFLRQIGERKLIAFQAAMGAGKTTFISAVCRAKGVAAEAVSSPTFAIVNPYRTPDGEPIYHFDFYRITQAAEILDIGLYDYIDSGCLCLMEWPENISEFLPEETVEVHLAVEDTGVRTLYWED